MNVPVAPLVAGVLGVAAAAVCALLPGPMLEGLVMDSGLPAVVAAAEPPLGMTARAAIAAGAGALTTLFGWFALFLLLGTRGITIGGTATDDSVPVLRRADAHPDAPARAPLLATRDLGTPFLEVTAQPRAGARPAPVPISTPAPVPAPVPVPEPVAAGPLSAPEPVAVAPFAIEPVAIEPVEPVEQDLPEDLGQPLSAFDPDAILEVPMPPPVAVSPLRRPRPAVFDSSERFETFELTPVRRSPPPPSLSPAPRPAPVEPGEEPIANPSTDATIHALLDRLEKGVVNRGIASGTETEARPRDAERGLEEALVTLRNLARRA